MMRADPTGGEHARERALAPLRDDVPRVRDLGIVAAPAGPLPVALPPVLAAPTSAGSSATQAIASVTALFVSGQIADRYLSSERFLALSHLVGGLAMLALAFQKTLLAVLRHHAGHQLVYVPTLSLTNSICFHHLKDAQKEFGRVRLWGTIGWIAASWPFVFLLRGARRARPSSSAARRIFWVAGSSPCPGRLLADPAPDAALGRSRGEERAAGGASASWPSRPSACSSW